MAVSSAFVGAKLEALLVSNTASSSMSASASAAQVGLLCKPVSARAKRAALIRRSSGIIRCEAAPDALTQTEKLESTNAASSSASASSLSALEQLKTSAADSMHALLLFFFFSFSQFISLSYWNMMNKLISLP